MSQYEAGRASVSASVDPNALGLSASALSRIARSDGPSVGWMGRMVITVREILELDVHRSAARILPDYSQQLLCLPILYRHQAALDYGQAAWPCLILRHYPYQMKGQ